jgi:hypothetical protein
VLFFHDSEVNVHLDPLDYQGNWIQVTGEPPGRTLFVAFFLIVTPG